MEHDREEITRINRKHWDAMASRNWSAKKDEYLSIAKDPDSYLTKHEFMLYPYLEKVRGRKVIVLQFGSAQVLLACALKGAQVTGVDISSEKIRLARKALRLCHTTARLVEADCQSIPSRIPRSHYDIAVAECGVLIWIPDLGAWMRNAFAVLKEAGVLLVQDFHPISSIAKNFVVKAGGDRNIVLERSYLDQSPEYFEADGGGPPGVNFTWKLSDVVNGAIDSGFTIHRLEEFYDRTGEEPNLIPNKYLLVATKTTQNPTAPRVSGTLDTNPQDVRSRAKEAPEIDPQEG